MIDRHVNFDSYYDPPDEPEPPCEVCYHDPAACICPACPFCGESGNLRCYEAERDAKLALNRAQVVARIRARALLYREAAEREGQYADYVETGGGEFSPHIEDYPVTLTTKE